jgi:hypothetical protein
MFRPPRQNPVRPTAAAPTMNQDLTSQAAPVLVMTPRLERPDDFYELLLDAHRGLSDAASHELNARLVLILANQVGSLAVLAGAIGAAREGLQR